MGSAAGAPRQRCGGGRGAVMGGVAKRGGSSASQGGRWGASGRRVEASTTQNVAGGGSPRPAALHSGDGRRAEEGAGGGRNRTQTQFPKIPGTSL